ncbi:MAG: glycoside hydrolase family 30 beta sandwich domain-containing protein [Oscillospiraceae bacterium]|nr:glycoside hydrolase family 30 beta sandwich domain-containing protein [Oscillospiraceae bacterium]
MLCYTTSREACWTAADPHTPAPDAVRSTLALGKEGTSWEGFGGCFNELSQIALLSLPEETREKALDLLFAPEEDGLRLSFCRMPIGASDYAESWYSHNETEGDYEMAHFSIDRDRKYLLPYIKSALKRNPGLRLFASPWSPPTWMKYPKAYNFGTLVWEEKNLQAYALYFARFLEAYEAEGVHIDQLHVQNEPVSTQKFPSCIWTGEQFREFIGQYLGPLFEERGIDTRIWLGTINGPETDHRTLYTRWHDYAGIVLHDPDAYRYVEGVSYQWAGKYALENTRRAFPEKKYIQSENECGDGENTWEYARYIFELFHHYISDGVCAYVYWNMILAPKGRSTWGWPQNSMMTAENGELMLNYEYYVMKHFSRFVQPGAAVMELTGHMAGSAAAFRNPDGSLVLVAHNPYPRPIAFTFEGEEITIAPDTICTVVM